MTATFLFWAIAAGLALASFAAVFAPLLRGAGAAEPRTRYAAKLYRDQLRELGSDRARGLVTEAEARATEIEISRRLLATAEADAAAPQGAPRALSRGAGVAAIGLLLAAGFALYARLGAPGAPDQPLVPRLERAAAERANRPRQAEAEAALARAAAPAGPRAAPEAPSSAPGPRVAPPAPDGAPGGSAGESAGGGAATDAALVARLEEILKGRPDDERGHRLLARAQAGMGDWAGARRAQGEVIRLLGDRAQAEDYAQWAEFMILATQGYVSPEAEAALGQALTRDPSNKLARYYSGLTLLQEGRPDLTYRLWSALIAEGPADAPWIPTIRSQIGEVARLAGLPPPPETAPGTATGAAPASPGPGAADIEAAGELPPAERQSMIEGMVDRLAQRLAAGGGTAEDWARLIRAQGVLGRTDAARASWEAAKAQFAADPPALATLAEAARSAGLP